MKIGIIIAMSSEQKRLTALLKDCTERSEGLYNYTEGRIGGHLVILMKSGIGKVNAAVGAAEFIRLYHPDCLISTGVAGGIDRCLNVMDVVVSSELAYHDVWCGEGNEYGQVQGMPARYRGDATLLRTALSLKTETKIHGGLMVTGDRFITDRPGLEEIKGHFPEGLAVDMESCAIAQTCHLYGVPFISFRIISDTPGAENHIAQYQNFWKEMADRSFQVTETFLQSVPEKL